jgi:hypothetical protein
MNEPLKIPRTAALIASCWKEAETALQGEIRENCPGIDEEAITQNFHARLTESLRKASGEKKFESAFMKDLANSVLLDHNSPVEFDPQSIARNLVAGVTLHQRKTEGKTGGDLGFVIIRPNVQLKNYSLQVTPYKRGLLTQAKLRGRKNWPPFTRNQRKVLPGRLGYLALLLYMYADEARRELLPFVWQLGAGKSWDELERILREDKMETVESSQVIHGLSSARIGTSDGEIIDNIISPVQNSSLTIVIDWPPGKGPGSHITVLSRYQTRKETVLLRH